MQNLQIINPHFITYRDEFFTTDILGGVDLLQVERMYCTLRISYKNFPPFRTTLDLFSDQQIDKLIRTLCDKWELKLADVSGSLHPMIMQLEDYRLQELRYMGRTKQEQFEISAAEKKQAISFLKSKNLLSLLAQNLNTTGILGEDENAVILFLALASHKFSNPFSVLCLAKSGIGKSYIIQKLSACMPNSSYSFHSQITPNALYCFDSRQLQNKALLIEDMEWTEEMLIPLATLQTQGRLVKTRATKDKDGMLHSTSFEVKGNLCLVACAYSDKNHEDLGLPFLCIHLNHSQAQDMAVMDYQKRCKAGLISTDEIKDVQHNLKCVIETLENVSIINPYATMIQLPDDVAYPRKSLLLLLNFIDVVTYFFQYQRERIVDKNTGEIFITTHPDDIEMAFQFLQGNLFRKADELSVSTMSFYKWLTAFLKESQTKQFKAIDVRQAKSINPRTLNRYLQELTLFSYIQVTGGNKHREGFEYKLTEFGAGSDTQDNAEADIKTMLQSIRTAHQKQLQAQKRNGSKTVSQTSVSNPENQ